MIITISPSSFESLQECPTKYNYGSLKRYSLIGEDRSKMDRGSLFHEMLEMHYNLILSSDNKMPIGDIILAVSEMARKSFRDDKYSDFEMVESCVSNYQEYVMFYMNDGWTPKAVETPFSVILFENEDHKIILEGRIDLIAENLSKTKFPIDHKTTERSEPPNPLSNQFMAYAFATNSTMVVKNEIGFQKSYGPAKRFYRHVLNFDDKLLEEWRGNVIYEVLNLIGYIEKDSFPRRYSSCFRCKFRRICESTPEAREAKANNFYQVRSQFDIYAEK